MKRAVYSQFYAKVQPYLVDGAEFYSGSDRTFKTLEPGFLGVHSICSDMKWGGFIFRPSWTCHKNRLEKIINLCDSLAKIKHSVLDSVLDLDPVVKPGKKVMTLWKKPAKTFVSLHSFWPIPYPGKYWVEKEAEICFSRKVLSQLHTQVSSLLCRVDRPGWLFLPIGKFQS